MDLIGSADNFVGDYLVLHRVYLTGFTGLPWRDMTGSLGHCWRIPRLEAIELNHCKPGLGQVNLNSMIGC